MRAQRSSKKPLVLYFHTKPSRACEEFEADTLGACRVTEYFEDVHKVRVNVARGAREKAIAKRYGVKEFPTFLVFAPGSYKARQIVPEPRAKHKQAGHQHGAEEDSPSSACHFLEACQAAAARGS